MKKILTIAFVAMVALLVVTSVAACGDKGCCCSMEGVKHVVANTAQGVTITFTAEKAEAVKALQEKLATCAKGDKGCVCSMEGVKRTVGNTDTGAVVTLTSEKAETVKAIQEKVAACAKGEGKGCAHKGGAMGGAHKGAGCCSMEGVKHVVANTAQGVTITFTAEKAEIVKALQEKMAACGKGEKAHAGCICTMEGVKTTVANSEKGVVVTMTSDKPETVKAIQEKAGACMKGEAKGCGKHAEEKAAVTTEEPKACAKTCAHKSAGCCAKKTAL